MVIIKSCFSDIVLDSVLSRAWLFSDDVMFVLTFLPVGILQGVYWGLGTGSGTITGGFLIHHIGAVATFRCVACCAFVVCLLFCLAQCKWTRESTEYAEMKYTYLPTVESKDTEELLRGYRGVSKTSKNKHSTTKRY